ncbi:TPA: hypothetical protein HA265_02365, partial [Candidatus Woesearchaeota archaeon]|nr:hypothetical protein [Candidatus Woesearchaeota archaeon]
ILQMLAGSERLPENITEPMFSYAELAACLNSSARFWERRGIKADMTTERANIEQLLPPDSHFKLEDVFDGEDVIRNIVEGVMPDGTTIPIFTYEQVLANEHYDYMQEFKRFGVVQPYRKERQSNGRENGKDVSELVDKKGQVIDPELTILAGGHEEAQEFMNRYIAFHASDNCNIKHLTKSPSFDPEKPQCRLIGITGNEPDKCVTSPAFFGNGRYMGVTADKLQGEREMLSSPAYKQVMEQIGAAIGKHVPERFRKELWHAMRNELSFTLSRQYYKTIRKSGMLSNPDQLVRIIESATKTAFLPEAHQKFMEDVSNMVTFTYAGFNYKLNISPSRADAPEKAEEPVEAAETPSETEETAEPKK